MKGSAFLVGMLILSALAAGAQDAPPCDCAGVQAAPIACLTEMQMSAQVKHIEMQPDRMGNHVNVSGVTVFEVLVGKNGRVLNAKVISGQPPRDPAAIGVRRQMALQAFDARRSGTPNLRTADPEVLRC